MVCFLQHCEALQAELGSDPCCRLLLHPTHNPRCDLRRDHVSTMSCGINTPKGTNHTCKLTLLFFPATKAQLADTKLKLTAKPWRTSLGGRRASQDDSTRCYLPKRTGIRSQTWDLRASVLLHSTFNLGLLYLATFNPAQQFCQHIRSRAVDMALRASASVSVGRGQISTSPQLVARNASSCTARRHSTRAFRTHGAPTRSLQLSVRSRNVSNSRVYATAALTQALGTAMKSANKAIKGPIFIAGESVPHVHVSNAAGALLVAQQQPMSPPQATHSDFYNGPTAQHSSWD
jgi:hypothetical protein